VVAEITERGPSSGGVTLLSGATKPTKTTILPEVKIPTTELPLRIRDSRAMDERTIIRTVRPRAMLIKKAWKKQHIRIGQNGFHPKLTQTLFPLRTALFAEKPFGTYPWQ